jgi:nitroimidazol reductase NimA-like FMN-containing flavoprotein (pyridoxamine 5'-phosphate oxidase superfamily)
MPTLLTDRTRLRRLPERGTHDRQVVNAILDAGFLCHVGFVVDGQPYVIPTGYVRADESIYVHGSAASRMVRSVATGIDICLTVTLVDGFVLARSSFHHSVNYRSVVVVGRAALVENPQEKLEALRRFTDHIVSHRFEEARPPSEQELKGTAVLKLPIEAASAKIRSGPPNDDAEDLTLDVWGGVVPVYMEIKEPIASPPGRETRSFDVSRLVVRRAAGARAGQ